MANLLIALLIVIAFAAPAAAQDVDGCKPGSDPVVNITPVFEDAQQDYSQNLAQIQVIASDTANVIPEYHAIVMGITRYKPLLEFHVPMKIEERSDGVNCAYVQNVDVKVGFHDVTVFVASEIPQGSCAFDEALAHEQKHINTNKQILDEFVPVIEERFKSYLRLNGVSRVQSADAAQKAVDDSLKSIMDNVSEQMTSENIRRQREVDSTEEYTRLSKVCEGELSKIAGRYRRLGQ